MNSQSAEISSTSIPTKLPLHPSTESLHYKKAGPALMLQSSPPRLEPTQAPNSHAQSTSPSTSPSTYPSPASPHLQRTHKSHPLQRAPKHKPTSPERKHNYSNHYSLPLSSTLRLMSQAVSEREGVAASGPSLGLRVGSQGLWSWEGGWAGECGDDGGWDGGCGCWVSRGSGWK